MEVSAVRNLVQSNVQYVRSMVWERALDILEVSGVLVWCNLVQGGPGFRLALLIA